MIPSHRTVVVGERLLAGHSLDDAFDAAASLAGEAVLSVAVLDRSDGTTVVAVSIESREESGVGAQRRLVRDLARVFAAVSVIESDVAALATDGRLA